MYKDGINNMISKIIVIKDLQYIQLSELSIILGAFGIEKLNIFSINNKKQSNAIDPVQCNNGAKVNYIEISPDEFIKFISYNDNFFKENRTSLYILRKGNFLDIKNLFSFVGGYKMNISRGGSQKAHVLSPLDLRLSSYIMAMFNCKYKSISYLNTFYDLSKDRYLSYTNYFKPYNSISISNKNTNKYFKPYNRISISNKNTKYFKSYKRISITKHLSLEFNPIVITKIPLYSGDPDKFLDCSDIKCPNLFNKNN